MTFHSSKPWHERNPLVYKVRHLLRSMLFGFIRKILATDDGRQILAESLKGVFSSKSDSDFLRYPSPFSELGTPSSQPPARQPIIITARFRSGSTLLWNLFRHMEGTTAYYEPLNERRWFNPAVRGSETDHTHQNVIDYWKEYDGLEFLDRLYQESWTRRHLLMDADFWEPSLKRYVETLIEHAPGRPVLQFNRIDFRLPWFRKNFSDAKILHLYRHPRDQWCSSLRNIQLYPADRQMDEFADHDHFYQRTWAEDLKYQFPFLAEEAVSHPYQQFYYLWKLSFLFGSKYSHHSMSYEDLVTDPRQSLQWLTDVLDLPKQNLGAMLALIDPPPLNRWRHYAPDEWFRNHEDVCETVLAGFFGPADSRPTNPLSMPIGPSLNDDGSIPSKINRVRTQADFPTQCAVH